VSGAILSRSLRIVGDGNEIRSECTSRTVGWAFVRTDPKTKEDVWERVEEAPRQRSEIGGSGFTCVIRGVNLWDGGSYSTFVDQGRGTCTVSLAPIR
jgi:hypothetical protein